MEHTGINDQNKIPLVVIVGPTAVGKTEIAIQLAERLDGEIVSADSRLFYRGMDIGTAKPTSHELNRVPHHLIDVANPDETWSLGLFQQEANKAIKKIYARHRLPFLVGGTGQFTRSVIEGWKVPDVEADPQLRSALSNWLAVIGPEELHSKLGILDPKAAQTIDYTNARRTMRALEVIFSTGRRFSDQKIAGERLYDILLLGLTRPRAELYQRIDNRIENMIASGFVDEVERLLATGYDPDLSTMSAIGYGEMVAFLQAKISFEEALVLIKRRTREFVRRQANWFKENDPDIHWFRVEADTINKMEEIILQWIKIKNTANI
jgi:tRNA dimethylallyltransferase